MSQARRYSSTGRELLQKAHEALAQGDLIQASEKGWGAAAQTVKAVAERRGWQHNGHRHLFEIVKQVVDETGERRIRELFITANSLHTNFYENWFTEEDVAASLDQVQELVDRLELLLS